MTIFDRLENIAAQIGAPDLFKLWTKASRYPKEVGNMSEAPFEYQVDQKGYVEACALVANLLFNGVKTHLGGLKDKTVLDMGSGFSLPQGGLPAVLSVKLGARQAFAIDISSPDHFSSDPRKVEFWKAAKALLGVDVQGLEQGRVFFDTYDTLHFDNFVSKVVQLQMSASAMWFRDSMFDVIFSNAVFEHVKDARSVLAECFRVLKPGGGMYHHWNPAAGFLMGGHDIGIPFLYPWALLRLPKAKHVELLRHMLNNPDVLKTANPPQHTITPDRAKIYADNPGLLYEHMSHDLNMLRVNDLLRYAREVGFEIVHSGFYIRDEHRHFLTDEIRSELPGYSDDELLSDFHSIALRKP